MRSWVNCLPCENERGRGPSWPRCCANTWYSRRKEEPSWRHQTLSSEYYIEGVCNNYCVVKYIDVMPVHATCAYFFRSFVQSASHDSCEFPKENRAIKITIQTQEMIPQNTFWMDWLFFLSGTLESLILFLIDTSRKPVCCGYRPASCRKRDVENIKILSCKFHKEVCVGNGTRKFVTRLVLVSKNRFIKHRNYENFSYQYTYLVFCPTAFLKSIMFYRLFRVCITTIV